MNHFLANESSVGKNSTFFQACDLNVCDLPLGKVFLGSDVSGLALKYSLSFYVICNAWEMVLEAKVSAQSNLVFVFCFKYSIGELGHLSFKNMLL